MDISVKYLVWCYTEWGSVGEGGGGDLAMTSKTTSRSLPLEHWQEKSGVSGTNYKRGEGGIASSSKLTIQ